MSEGYRLGIVEKLKSVSHQDIFDMMDYPEALEILESYFTDDNMAEMKDAGKSQMDIVERMTVKECRVMETFLNRKNH